MSANEKVLLAADNDRDMLEYLIEGYESQVYVCEQCGHEEPLHTYDLASDLREYLAANPGAPAQQGQGEPMPKMQWPEIVKLVNDVLGCEAHVFPCERGSIGHEMTGINFNSLARIIDRVRIHADPAEVEQLITDCWAACGGKGDVNRESLLAALRAMDEAEDERDHEVARLELEIEQLRLNLTLNDDASIQDECVRTENRTLDAEVERLRRCLRTEVEAGDSWKREAEELRNQLAEAQALLRDLDDAWNSHDGKKRFGKLMQKVESLSASAEPKPFRTPDCPECACVQDGECLCTPSKPSAEPSAPVEMDERAEFRREDRYIVIKRRDLKKATVYKQVDLQLAIDSLVDELPVRECLVIESDWPEYEPTWAAIEARAALERKP